MKKSQTTAKIIDFLRFIHTFCVISRVWLSRVPKRGGGKAIFSPKFCTFATKIEQWYERVFSLRQEIASGNIWEKANFKEIAKDCVAFCNAEGGVIDFGIENDCNLPEAK